MSKRKKKSETMRTGVALVAGIALVTLGCREEGAPEPSHEEAPEAAKPVAAAPAGEKKVFGTPISNTASEDLAAVLREPDRFAGKNVVVSGHVRSACSRMGCWMELASGTDPSTPACRVTLHGSGFFVPKDSAGSEARVEGKLKVVTVSAGHAAHLEEEGAKVAGKGADGSAREVQLVASGVELSRRGG
jgi:hypothetical protein